MTAPDRPPAGPSPDGPPPGPRTAVLTMPNRGMGPTTPRPGGDPDPVTNPQNPRPKWAVACLIAAAVLGIAALTLANAVLVPMAVVGGR